MSRAGKVGRAWNEDRASFVPRLVFLITLVEKGHWLKKGLVFIAYRFLVGTN